MNDADTTRGMRVLAKSAAGFGSAFRLTALDSNRPALRDENGSAEATEIVYTCHFEVDQ